MKWTRFDNLFQLYCRYSEGWFYTLSYLAAQFTRCRSSSINEDSNYACSCWSGKGVAGPRGDISRDDNGSRVCLPYYFPATSVWGPVCNSFFTCIRTSTASKTNDGFCRMHHAFVRWCNSIPVTLVSELLAAPGSTAFPKPIYWTHYNLIQMAFFFRKIYLDLVIQSPNDHVWA